MDEELKKLHATLDNIQNARPFEDLTVRLSLHTHSLSSFTDSSLLSHLSSYLLHVLSLDMRIGHRRTQVDEVSEARPEVSKAVETMLKKGKWTVPGYAEKFGDLNMA